MKHKSVKSISKHKKIQLPFEAFQIIMQNETFFKNYCQNNPL